VVWVERYPRRCYVFAGVRIDGVLEKARKFAPSRLVRTAEDLTVSTFSAANRFVVPCRT